MGMTSMKMTRFVAASALASVSLFAVSSAAMAQEAGSSAQKATTEDEPQTAAKPTEGDIVVVGSRIRRDTFNSPSPVQIVTRSETTDAGFNSTAEALQSTAVTGGQGQINNSFGGFVTEGGPGANTLSLRGLGATRTLILLNGRRIAPAGTRGAVGSADLNVLPGIIVDRFEVLKDGASSIYGSDAVAGVVNIVTRKKLNGFELEGSVNVPEVGAGSDRNLSLAGGYSGDRFSVAGSLEYYQRSELTLGDRGFTQCQTDYTRTATDRTPGSGSFIDPVTGKAKCYGITGTGSNGVTINTLGIRTRPGVPGLGTPGTSFNRFRPNAAVTTGLVGFEGVNLNTRDTLDQRKFRESLISPAKTYTGYLQASYDLHALGDAELYFEGLFSRRQSRQTGFRQFSYDYAVGSPLVNQAVYGNGFFAFPTDTSNGQNVVARTFIGFGNTTSSQKLNFYKAGVGLKGDFFLSGWNYDLFVGTSKSSANYTFQSFITSRLAQSLNVVSNGAGGFNCVNPANGCVAAPALSPAVISGALPQDWVNFIYKDVTGNTKFYETTATLGLEGKAFALPYGDVQVALGVEYRHSKLNDVPPPEAQARDLYNLTTSGITKGTDTVVEAYGEIEIPLLRNLTLAKDLTLTASGRYTDYKSFGSDTTYKVGGLYSPTGWLSLRGSYGTSFRAPAIYEQRLGGQSGFIGAQQDPCNQYVADGSPRAVNCAADGVAPGQAQLQGIQVRSTGGAALGLKAETSTNFTAGVIFQPKISSSFGDLSIAVDYYKIKVKDQVNNFGGATILSNCYNDPQGRAGGGFCNFVTRDPNNRLLVIDNFVNISDQNVRGIDYTVRYARDIGQGRFRATVQLSQYLEQSSRLLATDPLDEANGTVGSPKWSGSLDTSYKIKRVQFRYLLDWIKSTQSYDFFGLDPATTPFYFQTPDYFQHSVSLKYEGDKFNATIGVRNLLDKDPPQISYGALSRIGNAPLSSNYDYAGRTFFVNFGAKF
jgi:iron complex outermembrane recepter protein